MSYEVLARKWRPQQFDHVVGQTHVTRTLTNAIETKCVAHAYLFVGPRGVGKTTLARILAKALNCQKGPTATPCDKCDSCREIMRSSGLDVIEIDGASNTKVEEAREIRENVKYAPTRGPYKIYIIDEIHMLSVNAFNALLKTLEEPPPHVKFIFATTEPQKIPSTIISRVQRFDLRRISTREIVDHLAKIAKAEKIDIDEEALLAIARGAEGGLRDAESALDQLLAFRGRKIREDDVLSVFGLVSRKTIEGLALAIVKADIPSMLELIAELDANGKDLQRLAVELLEHFRNLLVAAHAPALLGEQGMADAQVAVLKEQVQGVPPGRLARITDVLLESQAGVRFALSRRTTLELTLVRAARAATVVSIDELVRQVQALRGSAAVTPHAARDAGPAPAAPRPAAPRPPETPVAPAAMGDELGLLRAQWPELVEKVGQYAPLAKGYLRDGRPLEVSASRVIIGLDPEFASSKEKLELPRNLKALQKVIDDALHRSVSVDIRVEKGAAAKPPEASSPGPAASPSPRPTDAPVAAGKGKGKQHWTQDPAVKRALETFHGDIVDIRE